MRTLVFLAVGLVALPTCGGEEGHEGDEVTGDEAACSVTDRCYGPEWSECYEAAPEVASCAAYCDETSGTSCFPDACDGMGSVYWNANAKIRCETMIMDVAIELSCEAETPTGSWMRCCCG